MVLTTPVEMRTTLFAKNEYEAIIMSSFMRAHARVQKLLCHGTYCKLILSLVRASYRLSFCLPLLPPLLLSQPNPSTDAVRSRNPSKPTLAHDAVAAAVSHKHHSIIRVGAGLIQFVHGSHSHFAMELTHHRNLFWPFFARVFNILCNFW